MIPYKSNLLTAVPQTLEKHLEILDAVRRLAAQYEDDHARSLKGAAPQPRPERTGPTLRETHPELAALWQWLILKYSPDQPRVAAGNRDGGQWTKGEGGGAEVTDLTASDVISNLSVQSWPAPIGGPKQIAQNKNETEISSDLAPGNLLIPVVGWEHHFVPWGTFKQYSLLPETQKVFVDATSGPLEDITANKWSPEHKAYNEAVDEAFKSFLKRNNINPEQLTPAQAEEFLDEVFYSSDPRIRRFNMRIWRELFKYWRRYGGGRGGGDEE